jgi:hypothetical protein
MAAAKTLPEGQPEGEAPTEAQPQVRSAWVVTYPAVSILAKDPDGNPILKDGRPVFRTIEQGQILPDDCVWQALQLRTFGHAAQIQALAP